MVDDILSIAEPERSYLLFTQARLSLQQKNYDIARNEALSCWRELTLLYWSDFCEHSSNCEGTSLVIAMFFEVGDCLRRVYENEKNYTIAGWFCTMLLQNARSVKSSFLVVKYQAYYVELLKNNDQLSQALEQAHILQVFLRDEFGEDYLDWLEDSPNAANLCEELEAAMRKSDL